MVFLTVWMSFFACSVLAQDKILLRLSGPPIVESLPLLVMTEPNGAWTQDFDVQFIPWHSPDMLRAMVAGRQVDAAIVTTATASIFCNRGINCRVALLYDSPVWIVSAKPGPDSLASLQGNLLFPFAPGEMPGLLYRAAMTGKSAKVSIRHTGGALEAVSLLLAGRGDHALLSEPMASIALERSRNLHDKGAPLLVKRVDMGKAWQQTFPGHRLVSGCMAFFGHNAHDPDLMQACSTACEQASQWVKKNPDKALEMAHKKFPALQMDKSVLKHAEFRILKSGKAWEDALFFLKKLYELSPASVGGSLPDREFFGVKK